MSSTAKFAFDNLYDDHDLPQARKFDLAPCDNREAKVAISQCVWECECYTWIRQGKEDGTVQSIWDWRLGSSQLLLGKFCASTTGY